MGLEPSMRGLIEKYIDELIKAAPNMVNDIRHSDAGKRLMITNDADFILGLILGKAMTGCDAIVIAAKNRMPNPDEIEEILTVITKRMAEMREAIFSAG